MSSRTFVDTNVLVYADDVGAGQKCGKAREALAELIRGGNAVLSTQILQEYFAIATRKLKLDAASARARVEVLSRLEVVRIEPSMILAAIDLHRLRGISFWDALVVRAAVAGGCAVLLSEDLSPGETYDGVRVESPFA